MYTQCPDCSTAFRVTAEVLKQAAGKVRCGGCGVAFNALEYLSEQMPEQPARREIEERLPELTPEPPAPGESTPMAISAEQSAALLKTLDELAGSDIRIEDTGVEWRVLDDDPEPTSVGVDELLDESPTPVDQFLTKTPNDIDASEIFAESANAPAQTPVEELRFDDNTPLPDDFDLDDESSYVAVSGGAGADEAEPAMQSTHPSELDDAADIALSEPEEWADILGEFSEPPKPYVPPLNAELEALSQTDPGDEIAEEPADAGDVDVPLDVDTQFALQAEAMGIDLSGMHAAADPDVAEEALAVDDEHVSPGEAPLEDEVFNEPSAFETPEDATELELAETGSVPALTDAEASKDTGEVPELELADENLAGADHDSLQLDSEPGDQTEDAAAIEAQDADDDDLPPVDEAPLEFGSIEKAMAELEEQSDVFDAEFFEDDDDNGVAAETDEKDVVLEVEEDDDVLEQQSDVFDAEFLADDGDEGAVFAETDENDVVLEVEDDDGVLEEQQEFIEPPHDEESLHVVPPQSEEEQTLNRLIDQELLSMAIEDEDGFASTIVVAQEDAEKGVDQVPAWQQSEGDGFESIIMEGAFVQTALEQEKRKADIAEAAELVEKARRAQEAEERQQAGRGKRRGMAAAAVFLALILVVQVLHQSREALATIPVFNETVGPLYRAIGMPLSPAWDVTGWHFEAHRQILDEEADTLTVISRIGNTSADALPYPLINISLTDRFAETIGTRTLDPSDYLTEDLDPSEMVRPGNNFTAVMTIQTPSENATGYKLQACYRQPDAQLRCHIPTFK
ncbi:MAG: DUF3426 domain-containing protein [Woeseiaceae bacterium]